MKETIESILIAFILAFVFRAFVVEAFVIPTGSMANTLLGAHMRFECKECGYTFDTNYASRSSGGDDVEIASRAGPEYVRGQWVDRSFHVYCPNCRYKVPVEDTVNHEVRYGDRILVLKYLYIPWISSPHPWDVVVFKTPATGLGGPDTPQYTVNYIKRLIGLPHEELMILFGDIYKRVDDEWRVQAKPKYAQDALWRVIYDNDFRPLDRQRDDGWALPWTHDKGGAGWDTGDATRSRAFTFDNLTGRGRLAFDPSKVPLPSSPGDPKRPEIRAPGYFTDWLAYDVTMQSPEYGLNYPVYTVNDLRLCFSYERKSGDGPLRARLSKLGHEFVCEIHPDRISLLHQMPGRAAPEEVAAVKAFNPATAPGPIRVEFANVDYQVTVRINDEIVFQTSYPPDVADLMNRFERHEQALPPPAVSIEGEKQQASLSHISLWRDVYYTYDSRGPHGQPNSPIRLGEDEYFVLGDNSAASSDARYWDRPVDLLREEKLYSAPGRVPGRFLLGRAFFVYWPAGFRPFSNSPAIVPDFGEMRLIH